MSVCIFGLWGGAVWIVDSASKIAKKFGMSDLVVGLTVVAMATSAPEFAVTVTAAIKGQAAISVGNVVGSNIFNLGIILGLVALFKPLVVTRHMMYRDGSLLLGAGFMLIIFFGDLTLSLYEGIFLFSTLIIYIYILIKAKEPVDLDEVPKGEFKLFDVPKLIIGAAVLISSAHFFVESASDVARLLGISEWIIGITIVAAGTSAPELATSVVAIYKGNQGISIGNLIGSDIFNQLGVLGVASILRPLPIEKNEYISLILLVITMVVLIIMMRTGWKITRREGAFLLIIAFL
ncbi:calcium/sodium antiporter, partial [Bacteroidota bacterium]